MSNAWEPPVSANILRNYLKSHSIYAERERRTRNMRVGAELKE